MAELWIALVEEVEAAEKGIAPEVLLKAFEVAMPGRVSLLVGVRAEMPRTR